MNDYVQLGIEGLAPTRPVKEQHDHIVRTSLYYYIRTICRTTNSAFADMVGVSPATVTKWLYTSTMPSMPVLKRFARNTGLDFDEVWDFFSEGAKQ